MTTRLVELVCGFDQVVPQSARSKNISPTMVSFPRQSPRTNKRNSCKKSHECKMSLLENVLALKMFVKFRNCVITLCETAAWQIFIGSKECSLL